MRGTNLVTNVEAKQRRGVGAAAQTSHVRSVVARVALKTAHVVEPEPQPTLVLAGDSPNAPTHRISFETCGDKI